MAWAAWASVATRAMAEFAEAAVADMAVIGRLVLIAFGVVFALSGALARRVMDQSQDRESEVQTHLAQQLRLFRLRR